jgi:hypothetical protein
MRKIAAIILAIILCAGVAFGLSFYSNGFESFSPLYIMYGGKVVKYTVTLPDKDAEFTVKSTGFSIESDLIYTVEIVPNTNNDFSYTTDGTDIYKLSDEETFTDSFTIVQADNKFTIGATSLQAILQSKYGDSIATSEKLSDNKSYFTVVVTTDDNKTASFNIIIPLGNITTLTPDDTTGAGGNDNNNTNNDGNNNADNNNSGTNEVQAHGIELNFYHYIFGVE